MAHFLLRFGPESSLQIGTVLFSDSWWDISVCVCVLNYDTFSIAKSSKTAENRSTENELETAA